MRVVLDTNVLFRALISPHGSPDAIYRAWRLARFELVTSQLQLDETRRDTHHTLSGDFCISSGGWKLS